MSKRVKKEINIIWMISEEEFNKRFTLAFNEFYKSYAGDVNDTMSENCIEK